MSPENFNHQYLCTFEVDPSIKNLADFMRTANQQQLQTMRTSWGVSKQQIREARKLIANEDRHANK